MRRHSIKKLKEESGGHTVLPTAAPAWGGWPWWGGQIPLLSITLETSWPQLELSGHGPSLSSMLQGGGIKLPQCQGPL